MGDTEPVGLAEAIGTVRAEPARAQDEGAASRHHEVSRGWPEARASTLSGR
ncbi:hypothetical protein ACH40E_05145 [Streptomyces acidicola]|uniref:hypothetical protein n=1 Tax=Streptomyces acidicola TaxID=2596892 RepID=UPI0037AE5220